MNTIDRRSFLTRSFALTGLAAAPEWLRRAMTPQDPKPSAAPGTEPAVDPVSVWREQQLKAVSELAKAHGKPLMVLVVPRTRWGEDVGGWYAAWINSTAAADLQVIGVLTLACATPAEVVRVIGVKADAIPAVDGVQMLLIDGSGETAKVTSVTPTLPEVGLPRKDATLEEWDGHFDKVRREGIANMTEAVVDGLNRHRVNLADLALSVEQRLTADQRKELKVWLATGEGAKADLLLQATAWLRRELASTPDQVREQRTAALAKAISAEVAAKQIPGSRWARNGACGANPENPDPNERRVGGPCGMGSMSLIAERFLIFYSVGG